MHFKKTHKKREEEARRGTCTMKSRKLSHPRSHILGLTTNPCLSLLVVLLILSCTATTTVHASSSSSSASYTSVRALDQFGHSVQLQHAGEAPRRHGRLVLSAASSEAVVVVSLGSDKPMVHSITLPGTTISNDDDDGSSFLAMACTGVKGDASWLIRNVQQQVASIWERYNHASPRSDSMAYFISRLLGSFTTGGGDLDQEWQSSLRREAAKWARPLGTQTMIFSTTAPHILMIEPSGTVLSTKVAGRSDLSFATMGKNSDIVMEHFQRLQKKRKDNDDEGMAMDASQLKEMLIKILLEIETSRDDITIMVETVKPTAIERVVSRYKNGKEISS